MGATAEAQFDRANAIRVVGVVVVDAPIGIRINEIIVTAIVAIDRTTPEIGR